MIDVLSLPVGDGVVFPIMMNRVKFSFISWIFSSRIFKPYIFADSADAIAAISFDPDASFAAWDVLRTGLASIPLKLFLMYFLHWDNAWGCDIMTCMSRIFPFERKQCFIWTITSPVIFSWCSMSRSSVIVIEPSREFSIGTILLSTSFRK